MHQRHVLAEEAVGFIRRSAEGGEPFFLHVTPYAPHAPATPAPRHARGDSAVALPRPPSFGEVDVGDKPEPVRARPPLTPERELALEVRHRKRVRSLQAVTTWSGASCGRWRRRAGSPRPT